MANYCVLYEENSDVRCDAQISWADGLEQARNIMKREFKNSYRSGGWDNVMPADFTDDHYVEEGDDSCVIVDGMDTYRWTVVPVPRPAVALTKCPEQPGDRDGLLLERWACEGYMIIVALRKLEGKQQLCEVLIINTDPDQNRPFLRAFKESEVRWDVKVFPQTGAISIEGTEYAAEGIRYAGGAASAIQKYIIDPIIGV